MPNYVGSGPGGAIQDGVDPWNPAKGELVRQDLVDHEDGLADHETRIDDLEFTGAHATFPLGGSRSVALAGAAGAYRDVDNFVPFSVPNTPAASFIYEAIVELRTENAGTSITPKIYNLTDATDEVVGSAVTATTWTTASPQVLTFLPELGKQYVLMAQKSNDAAPAYVIGWVQRRTAAT